MSLKSCALWSGAAGLGIALLFTASFFLASAYGGPGLQDNLETGGLFLWPSSIWLGIPDYGDTKGAIEFIALAALVNIALYAACGALVWLSLKRNLWYLAPMFVGLPLLWWRLLTL